MAKKPRIYGNKSNKLSSKDQRTTKVTGKMNLGMLIRKNREAADAIYPFVSNSDWVYEDMDLSVAEFSDITGADIDEVIEELNKVCSMLR